MQSEHAAWKARWKTRQGRRALRGALHQLRRGETDWERRLEQVPLTSEVPGGRDLRGAPLQGIGFGPADLRNTDLRNADLRRADLSQARLQGATLHQSNLAGAVLPASVRLDVLAPSRRALGAEVGAEIAPDWKQRTWMQVRRFVGRHYYAVSLVVVLAVLVVLVVLVQQHISLRRLQGTLVRVRVSGGAVYEVQSVEVTRWQLDDTALAPRCQLPPHGRGIQRRRDLPASCVSYEVAAAHCARLKLRLPSSSEWRALARALGKPGSPNLRPAGLRGPVEPDDPTAGPTGGLQHFIGNVAEWTTGSDLPDVAAVKGGGYGSTVFLSESPDRDLRSKRGGYPDVGFRCLKEASR